MNNQFSIIDQNRMARRRISLLDKVCQFCRLSYRTPPCDKSDHGWTSIINTIEAAEEAVISSGCRNPTETQAAILPQHRGRRRPQRRTPPMVWVLRDTGLRL